MIFSSNCIGLDYENFCHIHRLDTLESRRIELCKSSFKNDVLKENSVAYITSLHLVRMVVIHYDTT